MTHQHTTYADGISDLVAEVLEVFGRRAMARVDEEIESKAAAPARTGTAAETNGRKEPKDMNSIDHPEPDSRLARHMTALAAAAHMAYLNLADIAYWQVDQEAVVDMQLGSVQDVDAALRQYAQVLKDASDHAHHRRGRGVKVEIEGDYRGAHFRVWGLVADRPAQTAGSER